MKQSRYELPPRLSSRSWCSAISAISARYRLSMGSRRKRARERAASSRRLRLMRYRGVSGRANMPRIRMTAQANCTVKGMRYAPESVRSLVALLTMAARNRPNVTANWKAEQMAPLIHFGALSTWSEVSFHKTKRVSVMREPFKTMNVVVHYRSKVTYVSAWYSGTSVDSIPTPRPATHLPTAKTGMVLEITCNKAPAMKITHETIRPYRRPI